MRRSRLTPWLQTFLAGWLLWVLFFLADFPTSEEAGRGIGPLIGRLLVAVPFALLMLPIRLLLGLFPEPSPSSGVRFVRRALLGLLCGPIPPLLVLGLKAIGEPSDGNDTQFVLLAGLVMGLVTGVLDGIHREPPAG